MEAIKSWASAVCFAALAAGMAGILTPRGNLEKISKFAVSLFFLCCILMPVFKFRQVSLQLPAVQTTSGQTSTLEQTVQKQSGEQAEEKLSEIVKNECIRNGVTPQSVQVSLATDADGSYRIREVSVVLGKKDMAGKNSLQSLIKKDLGLDAAIREGSDG